MNKKIIIFFLLHFSIFSEVTINNVQYDLNYVPWYTGSLLSLSAQTVPKNMIEIQPCLYINIQYGKYKNNFSFESTHNEVNVIPQFILFYGFTEYWDMQLTIQSFSKFNRSKHSTRFADSSLLFGFQLLRETQSLPFIRFTINEIFPTGKYDKLNPSKNLTDLSGDGFFDTRFGLQLQKLFAWFPNFPMRFRFNFSIGVPSNVSVKGLNAYGGSTNTKGTIRPGVNYFFLISPEFSCTQQWVLTTDLIYSYTHQSSFKGERGTIHEKSAILNLKEEASLQFAPAVEYNFTPDIGIILGSWFSLAGKNTAAFASGVISFIGNF